MLGMISRRLLPIAVILCGIGCLLFSTFILHRSLFDFRSQSLHLPMEGLHLLRSNVLLACLSWFLVLTVGLAIGRLRVFFQRQEGPDTWLQALKRAGKALVTVGVVGLVIQLLTTEQRLVFGYFPALALVAAGIGLQIQSHVPNLILTVLLYFSAATHKLINFSAMQTYIPETIGARIPEGLRYFAPEVFQEIPILLSRIVVPLEFSMALLLFFRKTRRIGFALVLVFHSLVSMLTNNADNLSLVGFFVLVGHGLQFTFSDQRIWQFEDTKLERNELRWLGAAFALSCTAGAIVLWNLEPSFLIGLNRVFFLFSIIVACVLLSPTTVPDLFRHWKIRIWVLLLMLWSIYPILIGYRNQQFGWAMMSGASANKTFGCLVVESNDCVATLDLDPIAGVFVGQQETLIVSRQTVYFNIIIRHVEKVCASRVKQEGEAYRDGTIKCRPSLGENSELVN